MSFGGVRKGLSLPADRPLILSLPHQFPDDTPVCPFRALWSLRFPASGQNNALTCGKTGQGIVEVAGIEPASSGFSVGLLRAQPALDCRERRRYRRQRCSVSD